MGLQNIYRVVLLGQTNEDPVPQNALWVDLYDFDDTYRYAKYTTFYIGNNSTQYTLHIGGHSGTANDALAYHNRQKFYTKDKDNRHSVAVRYKGAWWY